MFSKRVQFQSPNLCHYFDNKIETILFKILVLDVLNSSVRMTDR